MRSLSEAQDWLRKNFAPEEGRSLRATFAFVLDGASGGVIGVQVDDGRLALTSTEPAAPALRLRLSADDFFGILDGRRNPDMLFMEERVGWEGDLALALRLRRLFRGQREEAAGAPPRG